jgi:protein-tyrosine-phosphatase
VPASQCLNVLFLCTGNSARSILAEAILNSLDAGKGRFRGYSAGSHPKGTVNPIALDVLREYRMSTDGLRSKSWDELGSDDAPCMDFVFTVCDQAASEPCPFWPGQPATVHWGMPDPAAVEGSDEDQRRAFRDTFIALRRRLERLVALPVEKLNDVELRQELETIGKA